MRHEVCVFILNFQVYNILVLLAAMRGGGGAGGRVQRSIGGRVHHPIFLELNSNHITCQILT